MVDVEPAVAVGMEGGTSVVKIVVAATTHQNKIGDVGEPETLPRNDVVGFAA